MGYKLGFLLFAALINVCWAQSKENNTNPDNMRAATEPLQSNWPIIIGRINTFPIEQIRTKLDVNADNPINSQTIFVPVAVPGASGSVGGVNPQMLNLLSEQTNAIKALTSEIEVLKKRISALENNRVEKDE